MRFVKRSPLPVSAEEAFAWHAREGAFQRLMPPWERVEVLSATGGVEPGGRVELRVRVGPFSTPWIAEHRDYDPPRLFRDVQVAGPLARWDHRHRFHADDGESCTLEDEIDCALPGGPLGRLGEWLVRGKLRRMFRYRHDVTRRDLSRHAKYAKRAPMNVFITGSTGLVGSALTPFLTTGGHQVTRVRRNRDGGEGGEGDVHWSPAEGTIDAAAFERADAVVHLAGESIGEGRWTEAKKRRIRDSRVNGTRLLSETLASRQTKPRVLVSASAIGYYGDRGDEELDEQSPPGDGFLPEVCVAWEEATRPAAEAGIRVVNLRSGMVLSPKGGALAKMLTPFKLCVGGRIGSGKQYWSWISLDDLVGVIHHALMADSLAGPINAVTLNPLTNRQFTKTLGRVLGRPTIFPMPAFAARLALGQMADDLLLASAKVRPAKLSGSGFEFDYPELEPALRHLLGK